MKTKPTFRRVVFATLLLVPIGPQFPTAQAQGTAFTYQGQLQNNSSPANGTFSLTFSLFTTNTGGSAVAGPVTNNAVIVTNGLFTVLIDFGPGVFTGSKYWLAIAVSTNGGSSFSTLAPRQELTPAPYAFYAPNAGSAASANSIAATNITGILPLALLPPAVITNGATSLTLGSTSEIAPLTVPPTVPASAIGSVATGIHPYSVAVAGRYAYVANQGADTLQIFDVSTPSSPVSVGLIGTGSQPTSVAVAGRYAYVANFNGNTFQIFDVSTPSVPVSVGLAATSGDARSVAVAGRYAYVVNEFGNTLQIFDVSNPSAPVNVGSVATGANPYFVAVSGRYAYVPNADTNTLQIFDVSTPSAPVGVGAVATGNQPYFVSVAGRYAYVANANGNTLQIFDVSNPSVPVSVGSVGTGAYPASLAVSGRYAYVANVNGNTLQVFDLGGAYIQQMEAGTIETGTLQTRDTVTVGNNLNVSGGLTVSGSARISGGLSVNNIVGGITTNILTSSSGGHTLYITNGIIMNVQ